MERIRGVTQQSSLRFLTTTVLTWAAVAAAAPAPDRLEPLRSFLRESAPRDVPALAALVVDRDKVVFEDAFGWRDTGSAAPLRTDCVFRIASMTKPITSLA